MKKLVKYTIVERPYGVSLLGVIQNDDRFVDNHRIFTSAVIEIIEQDSKKYAKTETGSIYELGEELSKGEFYEEEKDKEYGITNEGLKNILGI